MRSSHFLNIAILITFRLFSTSALYTGGFANVISTQSGLEFGTSHERSVVSLSVKTMFSFFLEKFPLINRSFVVRYRQQMDGTVRIWNRVISSPSGYLKSREYQHRLATLEDLKAATAQEIDAIPLDAVQRAMAKFGDKFRNKAAAT
ncbi:hypothetical protein AVEN_39361-1 [Araneus ventricosus]|uniref:Uncharacterized protein n=1 Tax=Araneus ventricosus TaxID=182803 RepID=A0A4Y2MZF8_ARAVE|nr:hypothetical protein AVEN_39361-1 [Araneus ventricosus]